MRETRVGVSQGQWWVLLALLVCILLPHPVWARHGHRSHSSQSSRTALQRQMTDGSLLDDHQDAQEGSPLRDNLWGSWLLQSAMQRDPEIITLIKKMNNTETMSNTLITGVALLGIVESVQSLANPDSKAPSVMGVVGSSTPVATLGMHAWRVNHLKHAMQQRQKAIESALMDILDDLEDTHDLKSAYTALVPWVGKRSSHQFLSLWQLTDKPLEFLHETQTPVESESQNDLSPSVYTPGASP